MTTETKPENNLAANRQVHSALVLLTEPELIHLLKSVRALRKDFRLIPSSNGKPVQAVSAAQDLLKIWNNELDRILAAKQVRDTYAPLRDWDNEGGAVRRALQRHLVSKPVGEQRPFVFADADNFAKAGTP